MKQELKQGIKGLSVVFGMGLAVTALCTLSGCGSASNGQKVTGSSKTAAALGSANYNITAYQYNGDNTVTQTQVLTKKGLVNFPASMAAVLNAGSTNRVTLSLNTRVCDYVNNGSGLYQRQDGSCSTLTPNAAVQVQAGQNLSVSIQGSATQDTAVSVDLLVTFN